MKINTCNICSYKTNHTSHFKRHLFDVHSIGIGKIFKCSEINCFYTSKNNSHLKVHLWTTHSIGTGKIFKCNEKDCSFQKENKKRTNGNTIKFN
jgi:hypothetical protein